MAGIASLFDLLKLLAGQSSGHTPRATGRLSGIPVNTAAFDNGASTMESRDFSGVITVAADTNGLAPGHTFRWKKEDDKVKLRGDMTITNERSSTTEIQALRPGWRKLGLEVSDAAGTVVETAKENTITLSVPAFVVIKIDDGPGGSFRAIRDAYGITASEWPSYISTIAGFVSAYLDSANVRLVWREGDLQTAVPSILSSRQMNTTKGKLSIDDVAPPGALSSSEETGPWVDVTLRGAPPTTIGGLNPLQTFGATHWSLVSIYPGAINDLLEAYGHPQLKLSPTTMAQSDLAGRKIFTRIVGQTMAHEILHALRYGWENKIIAQARSQGKVWDPHTNSDFHPTDLMLGGGKRDLLLRTGLVVDQSGKPVDQGVHAMAQVVRASQGVPSGSMIDQLTPRPGHGLLKD